MTKTLIAAVAALSLLAPVQGIAQSQQEAIAEAKARNICETGRVVNAEYLENGTLKVYCYSAAAHHGGAGLPSALQGSGLTAVSASAIVVVAALAALLNDDDTTNTTGGAAPAQ